jgi:uncharacterized membrane protein YcjF (UPF0283 family)
MALKSILKEYWRPEGMFDDEAVKPALLAALERHRRRMNYLYGLLFAVASVLALVAAGALLGLLRFGSADSLTALGGAGVTIPAMLAFMRPVGREWSRTSLLCDIAHHSTEAEIQALIAKLVALD